MRIVAPPSNWREVFSKDPKVMHTFFGSDGVRSLLERINSDYLHWERARFQPFPKEVDESLVWPLIKLSRIPNYRFLPFVDISGRPFEYWLPEAALKELHRIDKEAGGSLGTETPTLTPEGRERYLISSLMEEAIASSQIEGAATTRKVAKEMLRTERPPRSKGERMILNNYRAIRRIREWRTEALTLPMLLEIHEILTEGTLDDPATAGRFRRPEDNITVVDERNGETLHVPPPAHELSDRMERLLAFANDKSDTPFIHPAVRAILLHFQLAYDHPFVDGNGRTARAIFYWYMISRGYRLFEFLSISRIILRSSIAYARAYLYTEGDDNDATYFIMYNLRAIRLAMKELRHHLARKQEEYAKATRFLKGVDLNYRQQTLVQHALKHPDALYTIDSHRNSHGVVHATAASDLNGLVMNNFLIRKKQGRRFIFLVPDDLTKRLMSPPMSR